MQIYLVGGAIRDELLGIPVGERDWVVTGSTPEEMVKRGFKPVGRYFPVFLHPKTKEEYALARTERKIGPGYHGFNFHAGSEVSVEDDLRRRDLTINAIARDSDGSFIDPCGGRRDLKGKILRHVSPAFVEDPVRVLRVARFAARFYSLGFRIAPETMSLMREITDNGEIKALIVERVWKESEISLSELTPSHFFTTLKAVGALESAMPDQASALAKLLQSSEIVNAIAHALDECAYSTEPEVRVHTGVAVLAIQAAAYGVDLGLVCKRMRMPSSYLKIAEGALFCWRRLHESQCLDAQVLLDIFQRTDAFRNARRLMTILNAWHFCDFPIAKLEKKQSLLQIKTIFEKINRLDLKKVVETCDGNIGQAVHDARLEFLSQEQDK